MDFLLTCPSVPSRRIYVVDVLTRKSVLEILKQHSSSTFCQISAPHLQWRSAFSLCCPEGNLTAREGNAKKAIRVYSNDRDNLIQYIRFPRPVVAGGRFSSILRLSRELRWRYCTSFVVGHGEHGEHGQGFVIDRFAIPHYFNAVSTSVWCGLFLTIGLPLPWDFGGFLLVSLAPIADPFGDPSDMILRYLAASFPLRHILVVRRQCETPSRFRPPLPMSIIASHEAFDTRRGSSVPSDVVL